MILRCSLVIYAWSSSPSLIKSHTKSHPLGWLSWYRVSAVSATQNLGRASQSKIARANPSGSSPFPIRSPRKKPPLWGGVVVSGICRFRQRSLGRASQSKIARANPSGSSNLEKISKKRKQPSWLFSLFGDLIGTRRG